jgi:ATP-binding cassette, subfamily C (CFTR/MRP), member 1
MDDVMKGLDADTSAKCFEALLADNGILRRDGITVVLATHNGTLNSNNVGYGFS